MGSIHVRGQNGEMLRFKPNGPMSVVNLDSKFKPTAHNPLEVDYNPAAWRARKPLQGARIIVGFNVGTEQKWTMESVLQKVFDFRRAQVERAYKGGWAQQSVTGGDVGLTLLSQQGVFQSVSDPQAHPENGAQILLLNTISEDEAHFAQEMEELADWLATELDQWEVILEHQRNGGVEETVGFTKKQ